MADRHVHAEQLKQPWVLTSPFGLKANAGASAGHRRRARGEGRPHTSRGEEAAEPRVRKCDLGDPKRPRLLRSPLQLPAVRAEPVAEALAGLAPSVASVSHPTVDL